MKFRKLVVFFKYFNHNVYLIVIKLYNWNIFTYFQSRIMETGIKMIFDDFSLLYFPLFSFFFIIQKSIRPRSTIFPSSQLGVTSAIKNENKNDKKRKANVLFFFDFLRENWSIFRAEIASFNVFVSRIIIPRRFSHFFSRFLFIRIWTKNVESQNRAETDFCFIAGFWASGSIFNCL